MSLQQVPEWKSILEAFLARDVVKKGLSPLKDAIEIGITVAGEPSVTITKKQGKAALLSTPPKKPDLSFSIPPGALVTIKETDTDDLGELGIRLFGMLTDPDPNKRMHPTLHIGPIGLLTKGYLATIPLGGATLMKHLATKGFGSLGAIKKALGRLRENSK